MRQRGAARTCTYPGVDEGACYEGVCLPAGCGNGTVNGPEICDDGNRVHGDGCSADCFSEEICGNGVIDEMERQRVDHGLDADRDGLVGCADPDCFGYCTPVCNPTLASCSAATPRCGDAICQPVETARSCAADCPLTAACGDFSCTSPETMQSCPGDCS